MSLTPADGSGETLDYTATYSDSKGAGNIRLVGVLINDQLTGANACYVMYLPPFKSLRLVKDIGLASDPLALDGHGKLENSQCTVFADGASVSLGGNELKVKTSVAFKPGFEGTKNIFLYAENMQGGKTPLVPARGSWVIP